MEILRQKEAGKWTIGDQIMVPLKGMGDFSATVHKITADTILFIFDDYVACRPMNNTSTNKGGYEASDLHWWIKRDLLRAFPDAIKKDIIDISLPTVGMMFGHEDKENETLFESDEDEQLELMKLRKNRVAYYNNECEWGWLRNATNSEYFSTTFAAVSYHGRASYHGASNSYGVRPVFWVKAKKTEEPRAPRTKYLEVAEVAREFYEAQIAVGFTEEQAFTILLELYKGGRY